MDNQGSSVTLAMVETPSNHKEIVALIKRISGQANFIGTPRLYVDIFGGDLIAAVWFNQVVYWDGKTSNPIGFYKTFPEWKEELGLSKFQVCRVTKICEQMGLIHKDFKKVYGHPKLHYLVIWPELLKLINSTINKLDSEETKLLESELLEGKESELSLDSEETLLSLSIEETTTKSHINIYGLDISLQEVWDRAKEILKADMKHDGYEKHVDPSQVVEFVDNTLVICATSDDSRAWLDDRVGPTAKRLLVGIMDCEVEIKFIVKESVI